MQAAETQTQMRRPQRPKGGEEPEVQWCSGAVVPWCRGAVMQAMQKMQECKDDAEGKAPEKVANRCLRERALAQLITSVVICFGRAETRKSHPLLFLPE